MIKPALGCLSSMYHSCCYLPELRVVSRTFQMDEDLTTVGVLEKLIWEEAFQIEKEEGYSKVE